MLTKTWLGTILLVLWPVIAQAQNQHEALIQELYIKSGLEKQVQQLPLTIQAGFDQPLLGDDHHPQLAQELVSLMKTTVPEAFAPESLKAVVLAEFREKLTTQDLKTMLKWFDAPLGYKCAHLEEEASTPEALAEIEKYKIQLKNSPPTPERLKLIQQYDAAVKATKSSVETVMGTQIALTLAINATLPQEQQRSLADISREIKKHRPEIEAAMKFETLVSLLYTYRSLTEAEIQRYINFSTTPAGAKLVKVGNAALEKALFEGGIRWGKAVGEAMKKRDSQVAA